MASLNDVLAGLGGENFKSSGTLNKLLSNGI
jgi:hypothetical protein